MAIKLSPTIKRPDPEANLGETLKERITELESKIAELEAKLTEGGEMNESEPAAN